MAKDTKTTARKTAKKKVRKNIPTGKVFITSTFNNTIITVTDVNGNAISSASGGTIGFKGSRKGTPFAAQQASDAAVRAAMENGLKEVDVVIKGPGPGRESAIRALNIDGLRIRTIRDATPIPHNGCRPKKRRRV
ncbi:MAG: 30S ribosomal protein S11 [Acidobacteria bacterium]|jgi:small subunit ribosomal protein S11|nr:30S ribosomal protein S11 [Acidobacteriota bacterium]